MATGREDPWLKAYEDSKDIANETDRNLRHPNGGSEASRITAQARRKLGALGSSLDQLRTILEDKSDVSENEKNRRRDLITALVSRREQMLLSLKRDHSSQQREALLGDASRGPQARETARTAELDNAGLVQLQRDTMREQDESLERLEQSVMGTRHVAIGIHEELESQNALLENFELDVEETGTRLAAANQRHVAVAIGEELDQQNFLLEELDQDVAVTGTRMQAAQQKLQRVLQDRGSWKFLCLMFGLLVILIFLIGLLWRL